MCAAVLCVFVICTAVQHSFYMWNNVYAIIHLVTLHAETMVRFSSETDIMRILFYGILCQLLTGTHRLWYHWFNVVDLVTLLFFSYSSLSEITAT